MMDAGAGGGLGTDTARLAGEEFPQRFDAITVTFPPVSPTVAVMEEVPEAPDHPEGNVQA
jgi:hypothetical protein